MPATSSLEEGPVHALAPTVKCSSRTGMGKVMDARDERLGRHTIMGTDHNAHTYKQDQIRADEPVRRALSSIKLTG